MQWIVKKKTHKRHNTHVRKEASVLEAAEGEDDESDFAGLVLEGRPVGGEFFKAHVSAGAHGEVEGDGVAHLQRHAHARLVLARQLRGRVHRQPAEDVHADDLRDRAVRDRPRRVQQRRRAGRVERDEERRVVDHEELFFSQKGRGGLVDFSLLRTGCMEMVNWENFWSRLTLEYAV